MSSERTPPARDALRSFYESELRWLRRMAPEFRRANPGIADHVERPQGADEDPHVSRLIESFALLTARIRLKLDDGAPELPRSVLEVLYPQCLAPMPSASIVRMRGPAAGQTAPIDVPAGAELESVQAAPDGDRCRFRTCYPVRIWPFDVAAAELAGVVSGPGKRDFAHAAATLHLEFAAAPDSGDAPFAGLARPGARLRLHLRGTRGALSTDANDAYEMLVNRRLGVMVGAAAESAVRLPPDALAPVGFELDEALLPAPPTAFPGYALLAEYFAFPAKFLFVDLGPFPPAEIAACKDRLHVWIYFGPGPGGGPRRPLPDLEARSFGLGCTPAVNLFRQDAETIRVTPETTEFTVVPDVHHPATREIYSIDAVRVRPEADADGADSARPALPLFAARYAMEGPRPIYYALDRRPAARGGTDVVISLVDAEPETAARHLFVTTTCTNGDLPAELSFPLDESFEAGAPPPPHFTLLVAAGGATVRCETPPTQPRRRRLDGTLLRRLVSQLSLRHLSIAFEEAPAGGGDGAGRPGAAFDSAAALREILRLNDWSDSPEPRSAVRGLVGVRATPDVARLPGGGGAVVRGTRVTIELDSEMFGEHDAFLFASVLERFFAHYASINSFTRTVAKLRGRDGALREWPPRAGATPLI